MTTEEYRARSDGQNTARSKSEVQERFRYAWIEEDFRLFAWYEHRR